MRSHRHERNLSAKRAFGAKLVSSLLVLLGVLVGCPLALANSDSAMYFVHSDHLGTPQRLTDEVARVVWTADYEPFGKDSLRRATLSNSVRFPGQYLDAESGLHYNYYRDYDPSIGRYIEADPIGLQGGMNNYGYVSQNPVVYIDPAGAIRWKGGYMLTSGGILIGRFLGDFVLTSECINGWKAKAIVHADGWGGTFGIKKPKSRYLGVVNGQITMEDGRVEVLDPYGLGGEFEFSSASATIGDKTIGIGEPFIKLGNAISTDVTVEGGFDISLGFVLYGSSNVDNVQFIPCQCE